MKTIDEIFGEMLSCLEEQTGLEPEPGCDLSVRMYAVAAQVYALYIQAQWVTRQAFPQTAESDYLDLHGQLRGLTRKQATQALGSIRFTAQSSDTARTIPQGTVCLTADMVRFETTEDGIIAPGETEVDVPAQALLPGAAGNVSARAITAMAVAPVGVSACTNPLPFTGGSDAESDEAFRTRILDTYQRLPNGANIAFYEQGALSFDQVAAVSVLPRSRGIGTVDVVVATLSGQPDEELLGQLQEYFQSRREIAVDVKVLAPEALTVNVSIQVKAKEGADQEAVEQAVEEEVRRWFSGERLGRNVLLAQLGSVIYSCENVENYAILSPAADQTVELDQLPTLGTLTVEAMV